VTDDELMAAALGTPPQPPTGEVAPRRRAGGRAAHERSRLPQQRPWKQPRIPYEPVRVLSDDELESIHQASLRVLAEIGMDVLDEGARELLKTAGAHTEPGTQRVRFDPAMVEDRIRTAPADFPLHATYPRHPLVPGGL
jgi:trimethylamine--corrinoid protein Co-methyltransferase